MICLDDGMEAPDEPRSGVGVNVTRSRGAIARNRDDAPHHRTRAYGIVTDLTAAGYLVKEKDGRRNSYQIRANLPIDDALGRKRTIGEMLDLVETGEQSRRRGKRSVA